MTRCTRFPIVEVPFLATASVPRGAGVKGVLVIVQLHTEAMGSTVPAAAMVSIDRVRRNTDLLPIGGSVLRGALLAETLDTIDLVDTEASSPFKEPEASSWAQTTDMGMIICGVIRRTEAYRRRDR